MIPLTDTLTRAFNDQFNLERASEAVYLAASIDADSGNITLPGFAKFFRHSAKEEARHARKFAAFLSKRGAQVRFDAVPAPSLMTPTDLLGFAKVSMLAAAAQEAKVTDAIDDLYDLAEAEGDAAACIFLHWFIMEQVDSEREIQDLLIRLNASDCSSTLELIDKELRHR